MFDLKKIEEIAQGIDEHLRKLESFTSLLKEVKVSLVLLKESKEKEYIYELNKVKKDLLNLSINLQRYGVPKANEYENELQEIKDLINSKDFPIAVDPKFLCNDSENLFLRAESILNLFVTEEFKAKKFLDFGCGSGHIIDAVKKREASFVLGYDLEKNIFEFNPNDYTTSFSMVQKNAPYDIILIHDVLDHIEEISPVQALNMAASVLSAEGRIYLRTHPWCSRHGSHLYMKKNTAFLHLLMDEIELMRCYGLEIEHNIKVFNPIETYNNWIKEANLEIKSEIVIRNAVENVFTKPSIIKERLNKHWNQPETIENQMEINFIEYILESPQKNTQIF